MRLPEPLLAALKAKAAQRNIPYQRLIREALERALSAWPAGVKNPNNQRRPLRTIPKPCQRVNFQHPTP